MGSGRPGRSANCPGPRRHFAGAVSDLLPSGSPGQEVFWLTRAGQPAVTAWNGQRWQTTTLPGVATSIAGVSAYPVAGAAQESSSPAAAHCAWRPAGARILDLNGAAGYRDHARRPRSCCTRPPRPMTPARGPRPRPPGYPRAGDHVLRRRVGGHAERQLPGHRGRAGRRRRAVLQRVRLGRPSGDGPGGTPFSLAAGPSTGSPARIPTKTPPLPPPRRRPGWRRPGLLRHARRAPCRVTTLPARAAATRACQGEA